MITITVNASKSYDVKIGHGILSEIGAVVRSKIGGKVAAIVTDSNVAPLYGNALVETLESNGYRTALYAFPQGETSKTADTFMSILNFLASEKLDRLDVVVALGGGVVGDLAGFAASCYMRGVKLVQVPTTLLAMVDSSVGGKTGFNLAQGKNLAGSFYQPCAVFCDADTLDTLSAEIRSDGWAEIVKYAMLDGSALLDLPLEDCIAKCVEIKRDIVAGDEFESGNRKLLNLGHTIGHAVELLSDYNISHGSAVAIGMAIETHMAVNMGLCSVECLTELLAMLDKHALPRAADYSAKQLAAACLSDKKRSGGVITMVFPERVGKCVLKDVSVEELEKLIGSAV